MASFFFTAHLVPRHAFQIGRRKHVRLLAPGCLARGHRFDVAVVVVLCSAVVFVWPPTQAYYDFGS